MAVQHFGHFSCIQMACAISNNHAFHISLHFFNFLKHVTFASRRYGGPRFASVDGRLMPKWPRDGLYHLWFHAVNGSGNLPTDIYHAQSRDLLNWQVTSEPVLKHSGQGFEFDQVAGAVPLAVHGQAYMFYDGDNNVAGTCAIGLVTADARSLAEGQLS